MTFGRILGLSLTSLLLVGFLVTSGMMFQDVAADQIVVIQSPVSGKYNWYLSPGIKWQGFGTVTVYQKGNYIVGVTRGEPISATT